MAQVLATLPQRNPIAWHSLRVSATKSRVERCVSSWLFRGDESFPGAAIQAGTVVNTLVSELPGQDRGSGIDRLKSVRVLFCVMRGGLQ